MADAFERTEKKLKEMEKKLTSVYTKAQKDISKEWKAYMKRAQKEIKPLQDAYDKAKANGSDNVDALGKQLGQAKRDITLRNEYYKGMVDMTTKKLADVNQTALAYINNEMPWVYSVNYNDFAQTGIDMGFAFNLVDENVVRRMVTDGDIKLPKKKVDIPKDQRWNTKKLNSSVLQGIVNGESIPKIAERIKPVIGENESACVRNARTMVTGAENAGKNDSYKQAVEMGIDLVEVWVATPDGRTRPTHIALDGEEKKVGDTFSNGLEYPGDPSGDPSEVYNCRCRMVAHIVGFKYNMNDKSQRWSRLGNESIEDWRQTGIDYTSMIRKSAPTAIVRHYVAEGSDISSVWTRRVEQFDFEIEDVINAQGFDGLPRVVSKEEFDEAVKNANGGNGFIAQRTYSAPDQETLDAYRDQLYNGKWYVDCSTGGAQYGQGMYCAADYTGTLSDGIREEMKHYQDLGMDRNQQVAQDIFEKNISYSDFSASSKLDYSKEEFDALKLYRETGDSDSLSDSQKKLVLDAFDNGKYSEFNKYFADESDKFIKDYMKSGGFSYTETITLDPGAKVITYDDILEQKQKDEQGLVGKFYANRIESLNLTDEEKAVGLHAFERDIWQENGGLYNDEYLSRMESIYDSFDSMDSDKYDLIETSFWEKWGNPEIEIKEYRKHAKEIKDMDVGSYAVTKGYDVINAKGHGESGSYTVILNRTKCIILGE